MKQLMIVALTIAAATAAQASGGSEPPADAFQIRGSDLLYDRTDELRWRQSGENEWHVQTTENQILKVEVLSENVIRVQEGTWSPYYMFRIGSPEHKRMLVFRECVAANRGKPLFEVKDCGNPLPS